MSLSEISIILIVAVIFLKPEDYAKLLRSCKSAYKYFVAMKSQIQNELDQITAIDDHDGEGEEINFYMEKIFALDEKYVGDYNLEDVKAFYHKLLLKKKIGNKK